MDELTDKLNIAFATNNQTHLNEHFGSCQQLAIYSLSPDSSEHLQTIDFMAYEGHHPQKITDRLNALSDCFAVYCLACGNPVRQQLLAQGTRVVINAQESPIANLINEMQSNWPGEVARRQVRQMNRKKDSDYFDKLAEGAWDE